MIHAHPIHRDQTKTKSRDGNVSLGGGCSWPTPARGQGRAHVRLVTFVGEGFPRNTARAGLVATGSAHTSFYRAPVSLPGFARGGAQVGGPRRPGFPMRGWAATFNLSAPFLSRAPALRVDTGLRHPNVKPAHRQQPLRVVGFNTDTHKREAFRDVRIPFQGGRIEFGG